MGDQSRYRPEVSRAATEAVIGIRVEKVTQLFDSLDPFPYPHRDLARTTEDFIVGWARELPRDQPIKIVVHLPGPQLDGNIGEQLSQSFSNYFRSRAEHINLDLKELFRVGRLSLLIGVAVLALCLITSQYLAQSLGGGFLTGFFRESLVIFGWVANWRPTEIFLYDWLPLVRQRRLYHRLASARVELRESDEPTQITPSHS